MQPLLLTGISLKPTHYAELLQLRPGVAWLEANSETYFGEGGKALRALEQISQHYPLSLNGTGLSLGSSDELNWQHLKRLRDLIERINPCLVSEHLAWSSIGGQYLHELLPLPYTEEALTHIVARIQQTQDYLRRQILLENISSYTNFEQSTFREQEFLMAVAAQSGCGILLDINNLFITANYLKFDASEYIAALSSDLVQEIHLAGFSGAKCNEHAAIMHFNTSAVPEEVWDLFRLAIATLGRKPTIIEWNGKSPSFETMYAEALRAETIMREIYVTAKLTG